MLHYSSVNSPYRSSQNLRIASYLHRLGSMLERGADHLLQKEMRMSFMQVMILLSVQRCAATQQQEIVRILGLTPGAVSRHLDVLVSEGSATRVINPKNRRQHLISVTAKGAEKIENAFVILERSLSTILGVLSRAEKKALEDSLLKIVRIMEQKENGCTSQADTD
ncbi:MAG: MarR family winged helix-turn-helix transcriptional regulator [Patescibacteria group bacterium]|nr:MarR family winged helix-turn-helix transcriptional regulator [Patescibacteria group bacterium]